MKQYTGKGVYNAIAIGRTSIFKRAEVSVRRVHITDADKEIERVNKAKEDAVSQLQEIYEKAVKEIGEANAQIFETHIMMIEDEDYNESVENIIKTQMVNAEYAVAVTSDNFAEIFAAMDDTYMQARAADVRDISNRIIQNLTQSGKEEKASDEKVIICADNLVPSETVSLDKEKVLAFVTSHGSSNSHTAILARNMNIPAVIGAGDAFLDEISDGMLAIVDGFTGTIYVDPDEETLEKYQKLQEEDERKKRLLQELKGKENVTLDGTKINIYANIGGIDNVGAVLLNDAGGIGLFRSEFIYLEKDRYPTEEEQFSIYKTAVETMAGKRVIIRTLDIGADKQCEYFKMDKEENPALGYRAIRICLTRPEIFKTQLRALFRASAYGNLAIMYPMITSLWEVRRIKEIVEEVKAELTAEQLEFGNPQQGIMIETPAAVMMSGELAKEVDFFSIGTNDLTQYTLAIDRQNPKLDKFYDVHHPAVLSMIRMTVENAHKAGIWAGICGELGADTSLTKEFLAMGVDELSVSPGSILPIRKIILETDTENR